MARRGLQKGERAGNGRHTELHHNRSIDKLSQISTHNILIFANSCWTKEAGVVGGAGLLACRSGVERGLLLDDLAHRRRRLRNNPVEVGHGDAANEC